MPAVKTTPNRLELTVAGGAPDSDIESYLRHERKHLHHFFSKLAEAKIFTLGDLEKYTADEVFRIAPTSPANQARVKDYVQRGLLSLRPS